MHNAAENHKNLLFRYAVLSARLQIREFFLKYTVKEVYENIGQVLSLVRMQLASFNTQELLEKSGDIVQSGDLVGQSIRDLRSMCRSFYPDRDLLKEGGFAEGLELILTALQLSTKPAITIKGDPQRIPGEPVLITFKILLDVFTAIKEVNGTYKNLVISYTEDSITLTTRYAGEVINWQEKGIVGNASDSLTIQQQIRIVGAHINSKQNKSGITSIVLNLPLNTSL